MFTDYISFFKQIRLIIRFFTLSQNQSPSTSGIRICTFWYPFGLRRPFGARARGICQNSAQKVQIKPLRITQNFHLVSLKPVFNVIFRQACAQTKWDSRFLYFQGTMSHICRRRLPTADTLWKFCDNLKFFYVIAWAFFDKIYYMYRKT